MQLFNTHYPHQAEEILDKMGFEGLISRYYVQDDGSYIIEYVYDDGLDLSNFVQLKFERIPNEELRDNRRQRVQKFYMGH